MTVKTRKASKPKAAVKQRSPCPVACALDLVGDKWTLLIIRDLVLGRNRFKDFATSPEGIPTNILSERLLRLQNTQIIRQIPLPDGGKHRAYELTAQGKDLLPVLRGLREWGTKWIDGTEAKMHPLHSSSPT